MEDMAEKDKFPASMNVDASAMEKLMGGVNSMQEISWLTKAIEASKSICKIEMSNGDVGTGWVVGNKYVMTNNHVISSAGNAKSGRLLFGFEEQAEEVVFKMNPDGFFHTSVELDYTIVEIIDKGDLIMFGSLNLETFKDPQVDQLVNIINTREERKRKCHAR